MDDRPALERHGAAGGGSRSLKDDRKHPLVRAVARVGGEREIIRPALDRPAWLIRRPAIDQNSGRNKLIDDLNPFSSCRDFLASFRDLWAGNTRKLEKAQLAGFLCAGGVEIESQPAC